MSNDRKGSKRSRRDKQKSLIAIIIVIVVIAAIVLGLVFGMGGFGKTASAGESTANAEEVKTDSSSEAESTVSDSKAADYAVDDEALAKTITYNGQEYTKKDDVRTVLFMGVDQAEDRVEEEQEIGNGGRADAIIMFVLDDTDKTAQMVALSRDTMTDVDAYDSNGEFLYSGPAQITLQYAYGDSPQRSCWLMQNKVSEVMYGVPMDGYLSMTMDGIGFIVELLGGITAELPKDYTYIDESYTKGAEVTFNGEAARKFVQYRDINELESNNDRMDRQSWFMQQVFKTLSESPDRADLLVSLLDKADAYIETNLDGETIRDMARYDLQKDTLKVPGEIKAGENHAEYYIDEDGLQKMIIDLYYESAE